MKIYLNWQMLVVYLLTFPFPAWGLQIVAPEEGQKVAVGSSLTVIVRPEPGEAWEAIALGFDAMEFNATTGDYRRTIKIPDKLLGQSELPIVGRDKTGNEVEVRRNIFVVLPSNTVLNNMRVDNDQRTLFMRAEARRNIYLYGLFSDGIEREISSSTSGTIYQISDPKIAVVDSEGLVTAIAPGRAFITAKNGDRKLQIEVIIKPK